MGIRVFAAGILATDKRHGREIIITDNSDLSSEEQRALEAFTKLDIDDEGNTHHMALVLKQHFAMSSLSPRSIMLL